MTASCMAFALPGFFMSFPIALLLNYLGEKERKKALANSKVKLSGKDVVASFKILSAMIVVPFAVIVYTAMFYILLGKCPVV